MPLDVDEIAEPRMEPRRRESAITPRPVVIPPASPPKKEDKPEPTPTPPPPAPPAVKPEDVYALRDEAMSLDSALNKRRERVPDELSKTSVLNNRYIQASAEPSPQPAAPAKAVSPPVRKQSLPQPQLSRPAPAAARQAKSNEMDMESWLDGVFQNVYDDNVTHLNNPHALQSRMKGGGDGLAQVWCTCR